MTILPTGWHGCRNNRKKALVLHPCCMLHCAQVCLTLREQLSAAQHKNTRLTAARDKLEIILHDMEAAALEEQQQLLQQLAAANKALRSTGQQLTAAKQQLTRTQQELADAQQQLAEAEVQQAANAQAAVVQQPQVDTAAGQRQLQETAATTGREAATPPAVGAQAQVGGRHWLQAQGDVSGPSPKTPLYWHSRPLAPCACSPAACACEAYQRVHKPGTAFLQRRPTRQTGCRHRACLGSTGAAGRAPPSHLLFPSPTPLMPLQAVQRCGRSHGL